MRSEFRAIPWGGQGIGIMNDDPYQIGLPISHADVAGVQGGGVTWMREQRWDWSGSVTRKSECSRAITTGRYLPTAGRERLRY